MANDEETLVKLREAKKAFKEKFEKCFWFKGIGIGDRCLRAYIYDEKHKEHVPTEFNGVPVKCILTDQIVAQNK